MSSILRADQGGVSDVGPLLVTLDSKLPAPATSHELLLAFRFSAEVTDDAREDVVMPGPQLVRGDDRYECWWYRGDVTRTRHGDIRIAECDDYAFVVLERPDVPADQLREYTYAAYKDLLGVVRSIRHGRLAKIWNYFPEINAGDDDAERYRQFSIGRAEAFEEAGIGDGNMPAGTAVGTLAGNLVIIALVTRHDFRPTENPRQMSAYHYPKQYGPRSPRFSRGGVLATPDHDLFLVSGTAAIVGHESMHPHETLPQLSETFENLKLVTDAMRQSHGAATPPVLDTSSLLRVYLRDPADLDRVAEALSAHFGSDDANTVFLRADICRRELMVEIDGVRCG